ncbi:Uncharacterised protein [Enterobacter hormaechei]|nr:Uncharacterised protein [Enterobacter hormaechei]
MIALLQLGQHAGNRVCHFAFQVAVHLAFKVFFQLRDALSGHTGENVQQVGHARFVLHVVAHHWRLVGVGHRTLELFHHRFRIFQQADNVVAVIVRLGHLFGRLQQGHHARAGFRNKRLRHFEHVTVKRIEALGNIAAQLQVLLLVFTHRHLVGLVQQNVGRHQHRIIKQTGVDILRVARRLILELGHAAQLAEIGVAVQRPAQLRVLWHVRLNENGALLWIDTARQVQRQRIERCFAQLLGILTRGDSMQIHDAVNAVVVILHAHPLT